MTDIQTDPTDGKPGLRIETAAAVVARNTIHNYMSHYALTIRRDRAAGQGATAAFIDGLSGAMALVVAGGHASRDEVLAATCKKLSDALNRDLAHMDKKGN